MLAGVSSAASHWLRAVFVLQEGILLSVSCLLFMVPEVALVE